ncbi:MAG: histone deacetylase family protein [Candidatus Hodarchaeota archaeon]
MFVKIVYHPLMRESYDNTPAGAPHRLDTAIEILGTRPEYEFVEPVAATDEQILRAHGPRHLEEVRRDSDFGRRDLLYEMAALAAGGAILTAEIAMEEKVAFGLIRPPGHHASWDSYWGYCYHNNIAVSLLHLRATRRINSAFILDFDLHTGDGNINILGDDPSFVIHNPSGRGDDAFLADTNRALDRSPDVDIIVASAGFDQYIHDWGSNISTSAFRRIGQLMCDFAQERCEGRRYGLLEGGYNFEDLGMNVLAFCEGLRTGTP